MAGFSRVNKKDVKGPRQTKRRIKKDRSKKPHSRRPNEKGEGGTKIHRKNSGGSGRTQTSHMTPTRPRSRDGHEKEK